MARITLNALGHAYRPGGPWALAPQDQLWEQGGAYALLGPSGCGKTTLLNIISGLLRPSQGQVMFDGADVTHLSPERRNIAQVFQFPVVYDTMTVAENLAFPLVNRGVARGTAMARAAEVARLLHLDQDLNARAKSLTADAKQKISLGRGLVRQDVAAILFDEPLTVIDPHLKWQLRGVLKEVHRVRDVTMIYVTHDQTEALTFADKVVVMNAGEVLQVGTPEELFLRPAHTFVGHFIGSPGMNFLPLDVDAEGAMVAGQRIPLRRAAALRGRALQLGVRPEFSTLGPRGFPVRVERIEDRGRLRLARATLAGAKLVATVAPGFSPDGDTAHVAFDPAQMHLYADDRRVA